MNLRPLMSACAALLLCLAAPATQAADAKHAAPSSLSVSSAWVRPMPPGARVGAGYLQIHNTGEAARRLIGAESPRASSIEIHSMAEVDGVMRMRRLKDGIEIARGSRAELKPGADHLMFFNPAPAFSAGETIPVSLLFDSGERIELEFEVGDSSAR